jgi:hypothetical protein
VWVWWLFFCFCGATSYSGFFSISVYLLFLREVWCVSAAGGVFACSGVTVSKLTAYLIIYFLPEDGRTTETCSSISSKINLR